VLGETEGVYVVVTATVTVGAACADEPARVTVAGVSVDVTVTD